eukprot:616395-Amphidinium_carterae.1
MKNKRTPTGLYTQSRATASTPSRLPVSSNAELGYTLASCERKISTLPDLCVSSLCRGHARSLQATGRGKVRALGLLPRAKHILHKGTSQGVKAPISATTRKGLKHTFLPYTQNQFPTSTLAVPMFNTLGVVSHKNAYTCSPYPHNVCNGAWHVVAVAKQSLSLSAAKNL